MSPKTKVWIALILFGALWFGVLLRFGLWNYTVKPADGYLSNTFNGWEQYPVSRHLFLVQLNKDDFAHGRPYVSCTYPFIFSTFLFLAPIHYLFGLPYNLAHNFLPYLYVFCLLLLVIASTWKQLLAVARRKSFLIWLLAFLSLGFTLTDPLPWTSSFNGDRLNPHILAAGVFCYLSSWVFYDKVPRKPFLVVGIFLAVWASMYVPAWILAGLFFHRTLKLSRNFILQIALVIILTVVNVALPRLVAQLAGYTPAGSTFLFRSGLDGSEMYLTNIFQAVHSPADPRHWPTGWYFVLTVVLAAFFGYFFRNQKRYHPLRQAAFLLIPYCTVAIFLPQLVSNHAHLMDLFLFIPATFLMSFWSLQKRFWQTLTGRTYVAWLLFASLIIMSNILSFAQMPHLGYIEHGLLPIISAVSFGLLAIYVAIKVWRWKSRSIRAAILS